jgi:hypothetical protein
MRALHHIAELPHALLHFTKRARVTINHFGDEAHGLSFGHRNFTFLFVEDTGWRASHPRQPAISRATSKEKTVAHHHEPPRLQNCGGSIRVSAPLHGYGADEIIIPQPERATAN